MWTTYYYLYIVIGYSYLGARRTEFARNVTGDAEHIKPVHVPISACAIHTITISGFLWQD